ncbi:MAG: four-carbon acid sugar kinase family protein [Eubacteriales bacterium]|nr:four-carbon acid sugar kinase family protein [Eubacteriales bacterium]
MACIGIVADDLTGATTTGVLLARSKARTGVFFNEEAARRSKDVDDLDALIISSNSRPLPKEEAYAIVKTSTEALLNLGAKYFSKRIDTTLRGGIGTEIDAMLDTIGQDTVAVVVSAMPQSRRIMVGGFSVIDGVALINTPVAQDVRTPVRENYIPRLLASQTRRKVGLITLDHVLAGQEAITRELVKAREDGCEVIIVDAITLDDVVTIAKSCVSLAWNVLAVDPGPFTSKLAFERGIIQAEKANHPEPAPKPEKTVLIAAGSATPVTKKQMEVLTLRPEHKRISVEPIPLINGGEEADAEIKKAVDAALALLNAEERPDSILFETALHGELLNLEEEDAKRDYRGGLSADMINVGLGKIIKGTLDEVGKEKIAGLYTTGGDTMVNVCTVLGVECLEVIDYVIPQTDIGRLVGSEYSGLPVVGKGGLTGDTMTAIDIVDRLFKEATRK